MSRTQKHKLKCVASGAECLTFESWDSERPGSGLRGTRKRQFRKGEQPDSRQWAVGSGQRTADIGHWKADRMQSYADALSAKGYRSFGFDTDVEMDMDMGLAVRRIEKRKGGECVPASVCVCCPGAWTLGSSIFSPKTYK